MPSDPNDRQAAHSTLVLMPCQRATCVGRPVQPKLRPSDFSDTVHRH